MVQIMMKKPDENMSARTIFRGTGTWSFMRMGIGMTMMQISDLSRILSVSIHKGIRVTYKTLKTAISTYRGCLRVQ
jgi:hypothetical protein